jgi:hypothetical protein
MHFTTTVVAAISATSVLALPQTLRPLKNNPIDNSVHVTLASQAEDLAVGVDFQQVQLNKVERRPIVGSRGPFQTVKLDLGKDVTEQNLRCQIIDEQGNPIPLNRGTSIGKLTFAKGNEWTLAKESTVEFIICDPAFAAATNVPPPATAPAAPATPQHGTSVRVDLSGPYGLTSQNEFAQDGLAFEGRVPRVSFGPYDSVELVLGDGKNPLRCQLLDFHGRPIVIQRNKNIDTTFSDADVGPWKLLNAQFQPQATEVKEIVCDPTFVKNPIVIN